MKSNPKVIVIYAANYLEEEIVSGRCIQYKFSNKLQNIINKVVCHLNDFIYVLGSSDTIPGITLYVLRLVITSLYSLSLNAMESFLDQ